MRDAEAAEDIPHGASRESGRVGARRLSVSALHMGQFPAHR